VAIKILPPNVSNDKDTRKRFTREAQIVGQLRHPNIVVLHDTGEENGSLYMVMEYIEGKDLGETIKENGRMPLREALPLLGDIAAALDYAHEQGIIHRDVKPGNVMLEGVTSTGSGRTHRAVLMDFGIARITHGPGSDVTRIGAVVGTLDYIAPEQIQGAAEVDARADIYAFGVMSYQVLTGELPFKHNNPGAVVMAHLVQPVPDPRILVSDLPDSASTAIIRAMAKKPEQRFERASDLIAALSAVEVAA
jgi:serine/threonine protein kinase